MLIGLSESSEVGRRRLLPTVLERSLRVLRVSPSVLPGGIAERDYQGELKAHGGVEPYTLTVALGDDALPTGLTFDGRLLRGKPQRAGGYAFTVVAKDASGLEGTTDCFLGVGFDIQPEALPAVTALANGTTQLTVIGADNPSECVWSVVSGLLPDGLQLRDSGRLTGIPTGAPGKYDFEILVEDNHGNRGRRLFELELLEAVVAPASSQALAGKRIVISGAIPGYRRDVALQALVSVGASVSNDAADISFSTSALLVSGQTATKLANGRGTQKTRQAEAHNVPVIGVVTKQDFEEILSGQRQL